MPLKTYIKNLIKQNGPISIAQFMNEALAHPEHGYYQKQDPFGASGDFITAPEISQVFGELIGIWCADTWVAMGGGKIAIAELGPGRGTLMQDLLRGTKHIPNFHTNISIHMVETSPALTVIQQQKLSAYKNISWHQTIDSLPDEPLLIIANEFFDALPIIQYQKAHDGWHERLVGLDNTGELAIVLSSSMGDIFGDAADGAVLEICPQGIAIVQSLATRIAKHGCGALIIDYGYATTDYRSTLQALKAHKYHNIFDNIGDADITAHVDFAAIAAAAKNIVNVSDVVTQGSLLLALGIKIREKQLLEKATAAQQADIISSTDRLINPEQMGSLFKAIALVNKNLPMPVGF
jgi:NADH dehydrogenase [ubiquinone] 1 alpha subcomplex assembly factor 7